MDALGCGVQGRKKFIGFDTEALTGQLIPVVDFPALVNSRSNQCEDRWFQSVFLTGFPVLFNCLELALDISNLIANAPAVQLQLTFPWPRTNSPAWRLSMIPWPTRRGKSIWAGPSACNFPSWLLARMARYLKSLHRSVTLTPSFF